MAQRKKKTTTSQNQKQMAATYRNDFFRKMRLIIDNVCGPTIYPLIPQRILDDAFLCRYTPFKFTADKNCHMTGSRMEDVKVIMSNLFKSQIIQIPPHNLEFNLNEFYTVYYTILVMNSRMSDTKFTNAHKVKEALQLIAKDDATLETAGQELFGILDLYSLSDNDLRKMLYWYRHDQVYPKTFPGKTENMITISATTAETISVEVDGKARPAMRVGWSFAYMGAEWLSLKPADLGFNSPLSDIPLKVYIQSHAINRLMERIDCFWTGVVQYNMYYSLVSPVIAHDTHNNLLIEFRVFDTKAGYFRADIVDGIILIRTFLFITNNGTPEGRLLEKVTGLQKLDKKYLHLDTLSTFMNSDLGTNTEVQHLFQQSGCQSLIDFYNKMQPLLTKKDNNFNFNLMLSYLNTEGADAVARESFAGDGLEVVT